MAANKKEAVSPINGQPVPTGGYRFTSENAAENARKAHDARRKKKSITEAFQKLMGQEFTDSKGRKVSGAEVVAEAIMKYAAKGNPKMVEIGLALVGETPVQKIAIQNGQLAELIDGLREPIE